jgi:hypothetical protein
MADQIATGSNPRLDDPQRFGLNQVLMLLLGLAASPSPGAEA